MMLEPKNFKVTDLLGVDHRLRPLFRAVSDESPVMPPEPLFKSPREWKDWANGLLENGMVYEHVRDPALKVVMGPSRRRHARSLTISSRVVRFYALSEEQALYSRESGLVRVFHLDSSEQVEVIKIGGDAPLLYFCPNDVVLLDPRHWRHTTEMETASMRSFESFECARISARVDDEILLVHGRLEGRLLHVRRMPGERQRHLPWQALLEGIKDSEVHVQIPEALSFDELRRFRDARREKERLALLSVLT